MYTADIHSHGETVDIALEEMKIAFSFARREKDRLLCLIIGYGSKGKSHRIKTRVLEELEDKKQKGEIKDYILGSELDIFAPKYQSFSYAHKIPENEKKIQNPGAVYVVF